MNSYFTQEELEALTTSCPLPKDAPYGIQNVSHGHLSIARHYGGITFQGHGYAHMPETDELVRRDVVKWIEKRRRAAATEREAQQEKAEPAQQLDLGL